MLPQHLGHVQSVKDTMGASLISMLACEWQRLDLYYKKKQLADEVMRAGELILAESAYKMLDAEIGHEVATRRHNAAPGDFPTHRPLKVLRLDIFLTCCYLQLKLDRTTRRERVAKRLTDAIAELGVWREETAAAAAGKTFDDSSMSSLIESLEGACRHLILLTELYWKEPEKDSCRTARGPTVAHLIREFSTYGEHLPYNSYDLAILSKAPQDASARVYLPEGKCGVFMLAPQCFNFHQHPAVPKQPEYLVGMQNLEVLRKLDDTTKMHINSMQRQWGQKVTTWE